MRTKLCPKTKQDMKNKIKINRYEKPLGSCSFGDYEFDSLANEPNIQVFCIFWDLFNLRPITQFIQRPFCAEDLRESKILLLM